MTKNLFKWMMAFVIVASPMVFTACGDDDESGKSSSGSGTQTEDDEDAIYFTMSQGTSTSNVSDRETYNKGVSMIVASFYTTMASVFGYNYDGSSTAFKGEYSDTIKVRIACDALYTELKDKVDLAGGTLNIYLKVGTLDEEDKPTFASYKFSPLSSRYYIDFENATLNSQNFWIGDSAGVYTYEESGVTVTATQGYDPSFGTYWSGFAISGRTEKTYENLNPDQYNSVYGGTIYGNKFLVVQGSYNPDVECITFDKPTKVVGMHCANAAYAYSSMTKGDKFETEPFKKEDWFSAYITCLGENGDTISVTEVELAKKDVEGKDKIFDYWKSVRVNAENVKKMTFSFDGSRKGEWGLNTPAYMCVDKIVLDRQ